MVAGIWRAPILEHAFEPAFREMRLRHVLQYISGPEPGQCCIEHLERAVEHELAFDMHLELTAVLLEFPGI